MLFDHRLLVIIRLRKPDDAIVDALVDSGVHAIEISLLSSDALVTLARWRSTYPQLAIGSGTVLTAEDAERAIDAGAQYLISPGFEERVSLAAAEACVPYIPGAFTPTEVARACAGGAQMIKLFPAARLGPHYVRDILGPFPDVRLVATGGIDGTNASAFLQAGAAAVAIGASLVRDGRNPAEIRAEAQQLVHQLQPPSEGDDPNAN